MDYLRIYNSLITRAKNRILDEYCEKHHIVPKCIGGNNNKQNIVELTAEEHFIAHQLLVKIYPTCPKLVFAARMMAIDSNGKRKNNKMHSWLRKKYAKEISIMNTGRTGVFGKNNPRYGKPGTQLGKRKSPETIEKLRNSVINSRKVLCVDTGQEFISMSEAARKVLGNKQGISLACHNKTKRYRGFKWQFVI